MKTEKTTGARKGNDGRNMGNRCTTKKPSTTREDDAARTSTTKTDTARRSTNRKGRRARTTSNEKEPVSKDPNNAAGRRKADYRRTQGDQEGRQPTTCTGTKETN